MKSAFGILMILSWLQLSLAQKSEDPEYGDLVFLVDGSDNMEERAFNQVKVFLAKIISDLQIGVDKYRIGLAQFSDDLQMTFPLSTYKARNPILSHIKNRFVFQGGSLMTGQALAKVQETFWDKDSERDKSKYPQVLVVITSGPSLDDVNSHANALKQNNVRIITLGLKNAQTDQLEAMSSSPSFSFTKKNVRELTSFSKDMVTAINQSIKYQVHVPTTQESIVTTTTASLTTAYPNGTNDNHTAVCGQGVATDVVIMVDTSQHTISESTDLKNFLLDLVSGLNISYYCAHVGIVTYNSRAQVITSLDIGTNKSIVEKFINEIKATNEKISNIGYAINYTRSKVFGNILADRKSQGIQQLAILVSHRSSADSVAAAAHLLRSDVRVLTVGIADANVTQMQMIASYPANLHQVTVKTFSDLSKTAENLRKKIQNIIDEENILSDITERTRRGCLNTEVADIYFLIDGSGSISDSDFKDIKTFLKELVDMFEVGPQKVRFGAVQYAEDIRQEIAISTEYDKSNLKRAIQNINQLGGGTKTGKALNFTHHLITSPGKFTSRNVPKYLIVLTDGESSDSVKEAAKIIRNDRINIFAIGVKAANHTQLLEIAGDHQRVIFVQDFDLLKDIKHELVQEICSTKACEQAEVDAIFLVHSSRSIEQYNMNLMKKFMKNLVSRAEVGPNKMQFGIVTFSNTSMKGLMLNKNRTKDTILKAIDKMNHLNQGTSQNDAILDAIDKMNTYTGDALTIVSDFFSLRNGARPKTQKILIVITDGKEADHMEKAAAALRDSGVNIISVGIFDADKRQLVKISGKTSHVYHLETFDLLETIENKVILDMCSPPEDCPRIEVADIVYVIDSSGSIHENQYKIMKDFMTSLVNKSDIGPNKVQFGALKYSDDPIGLFYLNQYSSKQDIVNAIEKDTVQGGSTYTAKALQFSKEFFKEIHGSRHLSGVPQILIIITDGDSHDRNRLNETAKSLQEAGVNIYAIGVKEANTDELKIMAGSSGKWFFVKEFGGLNDVLINVSDATCQRTRCETEELDIVFLIDGSSSIWPVHFEELKGFMLSAIEDFDIGPNKVHVGVAQFSNAYKTEFLLKSYLNKETLKENVKNIKQIFGGTHIGKAITSTDSLFFNPLDINSRINMGVPQVLVVITDGDSQDAVAIPAEALRKKGVTVYAVGVGSVSETQLLQIAGSSNNKFSVEKFSELKNIKPRIVREACTESTANNCSVGVVMSFDISSYASGAGLFHGQHQLEDHITNILDSMMNVRSTSCNHGLKPQVSISLYMPNANAHVNGSHFQVYSPDIARNLKKSQVSRPSHLNSSILKSMWETFHSKSTDSAKMLLVFTDGLDEDVESLKQTVDNLRNQGLNALITVALEGTMQYNDIKYIEFGRGLEYKTQMHIGMTDIAARLAKQMSRVAEKTCCCVFCTCVGSIGIPGTYGKPGKQGLPGYKGRQGHEGEEGREGQRGLQGATGEPGDNGCQGFKGLKGNRGTPGGRSEDGEPGLDGLRGEQGNPGSVGRKGEPGESGEAGRPGLMGTKGERGHKGQKGSAGEPGTNSNIPGAKGIKGDAGFEGNPGQEGKQGQPGERGNGRIPGRRGPPGLQGLKGDIGEPGFLGDEGFKGPQGIEGIKGIKGEKGKNGANGIPGSFGSTGSKGSPGNPGAKGKKGEIGDPGERGNPGQPGTRGPVGDDGKFGIGPPGKKGTKGQLGFTGFSGNKGEHGDPGINGERGPKGIPGGSVSGKNGDMGEKGQQGYPGQRGRKGTKGQPAQSTCELIDMIRNKCPCCQGSSLCPVHPTDLVFALDMASDVTEGSYTRMKDIIIHILQNIKIRESNCPVGARIAVVSYNTYTKYLVRFSDFQHKDKLIQVIKNLPLVSSSAGRNIGSSMRFVARNMFKRSLQGPTVKKVAIFFSNGKSQDTVSINTAVMEYNGLGIIPAVIAFSPVPAIKQAFSMDDTGTFQLIDIPANVDFKPFINTLQTCTLCYDRCKPDTLCVQSNPSLQKPPMDIAFLLDSSYNTNNNEFEEAKGFLSMIIDRLDISSTGDRVAVISNTASGSNTTAHLEFDLTTYSDKELMKKHLQENTHHLQGPPALGYTLKWTLDNVMSKVQNLKKHKAVIIISYGETSLWDKASLSEVSLQARCQGYALSVISLGKTYNNTELMNTVSNPTDHHLLQLGRIHKPDFGYTLGFMHSFLNSIRWSINKYPPPQLKSKCSKLTSI